MWVFELNLAILRRSLLGAFARIGWAVLTFYLLLIEKLFLNLIKWLSQLKILVCTWLYNFHSKGTTTFYRVVLNEPIVNNDKLHITGFTFMISLLSLMRAKLRGILSYLHIYLVSWEVEAQLWSRMRVLRRLPVWSTELIKIRIFPKANQVDNYQGL